MLLRAGEVNSEISYIGGNLLSGLKEVCGQIIFLMTVVEFLYSSCSCTPLIKNFVEGGKFLENRHPRPLNTAFLSS